MMDLNSAKAAVEDLVGNDARSANFQQKKLLMQAYQASGIAKATSVSEYIVDFLSGWQSLPVDPWHPVESIASLVVLVA